MRDRFVSAVVLAAAATIGAAASLGKGSPPTPLVAHEWGTFTSIAGANGAAVEWLPRTGPSDLPAFVEQLGVNLKATMVGTVRMETPVLYFYAPRETTVSVGVRFPRGVLTEWFPRAEVAPPNVNNIVAARDAALAWKNVTISPNLAPDFPTEPNASSHYYVARQTDATPLQAGAQRERFLFYRGVGRFQPPLSAIVDAAGAVRVTETNGEPLGDVIRFDNHDGRVAYEVRRADGRELTFAPLTPADESPTPSAELVTMLTAAGLYRKEAEAMVATWRDSWFEEGSRLFYLARRPAVDAIVPLTIDPAPRELVRVFVGRIELITPATRRAIAAARAAHDRAALARYGRFLDPFIAAMAAP